MKSIVHIITPIITEGIRSLDDVDPFLRADLEVRHSLIKNGPASIECAADEALSVPGILEEAIAAEQAGASAIIIDCMGDPGLEACREVVSIPVLGPAQTCMHYASMLGQKFAFITVLDQLKPMIDGLAARYGLMDNYAGFGAINVPVLDIEERIDDVIEQLFEASLHSITKSRAGAIILGCTGFFGCAEAIATRLEAAGYTVPVLDPIPLALHAADALVKTGLSHSGSIYHKPRRKALRGYSLQGFYDVANS
ncbi:MAG: hydrogenase expression protein HupH [Haliea sp.]|uniref:aspartate/glutamate racemase family protein n=1 Tax=Haliea sp. TaxID=1932666 RepID=UPI000C675BA0|nr:aspartate/glutamate racemase family protein [Haliea sp.]MBM69131.1 hydrogenase expression protein HupH [Haliea sp.]|tara:strand:+ start:71054 stop:71812 length:759 start_codon:yes stop_codon:yes gene_type:complete